MQNDAFFPPKNIIYGEAVLPSLSLGLAISVDLTITIYTLPFKMSESGNFSNCSSIHDLCCQIFHCHLVEFPTSHISIICDTISGGIQKF